MTNIGQYAQMACIWEVTAQKPGNVNRQRDFAGLGYVDFLLSASAIAPVLDRAGDQRVGETVLDGVKATRRLVATNTNLGILLLLSPLAAVPSEEELLPGVQRVLDDLDVNDARAVFEAIRLAQPGGLNRVAHQDVQDQPTLPLRQIMALAADRDLVARQYGNGFQEIFDEGVPALEQGLTTTACLEHGIIWAYLHLLAKFPDSLIARKRGRAEAEEASRRTREVLDAGWPTGPRAERALADLDAWLRAEGNGRNPGTSADLVTASLFAALRMGIIKVPPPWPWSAEKRHA